MNDVRGKRVLDSVDTEVETSEMTVSIVQNSSDVHLSLHLSARSLGSAVDAKCDWTPRGLCIRHRVSLTDNSHVS